MNQHKVTGVLFNTDMVRALMDGSKTRTRRVINPQPTFSPASGFGWKGFAYGIGFSDEDTSRNFAHSKANPYGKPGNKIFVREKIQATQDGTRFGVKYLADDKIWWLSRDFDEQWLTMYDYRGSVGAVIPSIHMPRWCARTFLEITSVKVCRLQDITEEEAKSEGVLPNCSLINHGNCNHDEWINYLAEKHEGFPCFTARDSFLTLWQSIYGAESWNANPWVFDYSLKLL